MAGAGAPKRVLVLGGSGFVGGYVHHALAAAGLGVETTSSSGARATHAFDIRALDQRTGHDLLAAGRYDVIVNCIARLRGTLEELFEVNVRQSLALPMALRETGVHFVQISTVLATAENRRFSDYSLTKFLADELLLHCARETGLRAAIFRFGQLFDLRGEAAKSQPALFRWVSQVRARDRVEVHEGSPRTYLPVELCGHAIRHAVELGLTGVHDVIPPERFTPREMALLLVRYAGHDPGAIQVHPTASAPSYSIPECSASFAAWFTHQESVTESLRKLVQRD